MALPSEPDLRWLVARYAHLRASHASVLADPLLVEPTGQFFPDPFAMEGEALLRLFRRVMSYAPLAEGLPVELALAEAEEGAGGCGTGGCGSGGCGPSKSGGCGSGACGPKASAGGGCGSGGCGSGACGTEGGERSDPLEASGRVVELAEGYGVLLRPADLKHPTLLTSALSRAAGTLVLREGGEDVAPAELGPMSEVAAAACGLGVLLFGGASVYVKGCGGVRREQNTYLGVGELAVLTALFCRVHGQSPGRVRSHVDATQKEAFAEALAWVDSNDALVDNLRTTPALLEGGVFSFAPTKGFFARLFGRKAKTDDAVPVITAPKARPARSAEDERRLLEARALVEEALSEGEA